MVSPVTFAVVGTQRTGTTLVRTCLDSHPRVRCIGEAFMIWERGRYDGELGYYRYLAESRWRRIGDSLYRKRVVYQYLDYLFSQPGFGAIGFKFMYNQRVPFPSVMAYLREKKVHAVHVVRENLLKTHVSRLAARERRQHHSTEAIAATRVHVPVQGLPEALRRIAHDQSRWTAILQGRVPYLRVSYESFVRNREEESTRLLAFLGLDSHALATPLVKLNPDTLARVIGNYAEVRAALAQTPYAEHLE